MNSWIDIIENVIKMSDHRAEPETLTPVVKFAGVTVYPEKKSPDSYRYLMYTVYADKDPDNKIDIRRFAVGKEPDQYTGLPDYSDDPKQSVAQFSKLTNRADTLAHYGVEKPPETRMNHEWVQWRKTAIIAMLRAGGYRE